MTYVMHCPIGVVRGVDQLNYKYNNICHELKEREREKLVEGNIS
jgi:hypothetical protein